MQCKMETGDVLWRRWKPARQHTCRCCWSHWNYRDTGKGCSQTEWAEVTPPHLIHPKANLVLNREQLFN